VAVDAVRLLSLSGGQAIAAQHVFAMGDRIQMPWLHAMANATQMIELEFRRNRPSINIEGKAVGRHLPAFKAHLAVAKAIISSCVQPTAGIPVDLNMRPESLDCAHLTLAR
jgi:hypothetical protein